MWVLFTTRFFYRLLPEALSLRLDEVLEEDAELVLKRAAELDDDVRLPEAAYDLMVRSNFAVMDLALVGRWSGIRGRSDEKAWRKALDRIVEAQGKNTLRPFRRTWHTAVMHAGLDELAGDNPKNKELYAALVVMPHGLSFPLEAAAVLLYGNNLSAEDLKAAGGVVATLERWSILTLEGGGKYRVHDSHADFVLHSPLRLETLDSWQSYISSVRALVTYSIFWLVEIWEVFRRSRVTGQYSTRLRAQPDGSTEVSRPYDSTVIVSAASSNAELSETLGRAARFYLRKQDWVEARKMYSELLKVEESVYGEQSLEAATALLSLGACASREGLKEKAEKCCRRALAIRKEKLGNGHLDVGGALHALGVCVHALLEQTKEAEEFHRQALVIRKEKLDANHPDAAKVLHSLGVCLYSSVDRVEEAEDLYRQALAIRAKKLGAGHPDLSSTLYNLGKCACVAGRMEEARLGSC